MIRRRVINGQTYIRVRSGGWRRSAVAADPVAARIAETVAPSIIEQPATESARHRQWRGKYDMLRQPVEIERQERA